jgi:hypothetical protein
MEPSPSEDGICSVSQEILAFLWNLKVHKSVALPYPEPDKSGLHLHTHI